MNGTLFSCYVNGKESLLIQCTEILLERGHDVRGIISAAQPIVEWANANDLPVIQPGKGLAERLGKRPFDYFFSITNLSIIPDEVLALPKKGAINFHDGPLPRYAGLQATSWALMHQEPTHGVTWHTMTTDVDKGKILGQKMVDIVEGETAFTLNVKCYEAAIDSFGELVDGLANDAIEPQTQDMSGRSYFGKYSRPETAVILQWNRPAAQLVALIRALDFGAFAANPLGLPKMVVGNNAYVVAELTESDTKSTAVPGTIVSIDDEKLTIATSSNNVVVGELLTLQGKSVAVAGLDLPAGQQLSILDEAAAEDVTAVYNQLARQEAFWVKRLSNLTAAELSYADRSNQQGGKLAAAPMAIPAAVSEFLAEQEVWSQADFLTAAFAAYLARFSGSEMFHLGLQRSAETTTPHLFATAVPMQIAVDGQMTATAVLDKLQTELTNIADKHKTYALDTVLRFPELAELKGQANIYPIAVQQAELLDETADTVGSELTLVVAENGAACRWMYDTAVYNADAIQAMQQQFTIFLQNLVAADADPLAQIAILSEAEQHKLLVDWNETAVSYNKNACVHTLIETQAQKTPDAIAVVFEDQQISYRQLNRRANQMARYLSHLGVGPDKIVGVYMDRSIEMMVGLIGIHKAGGAYLPLDPNYPADRIAYMVEDSDTAVILTQDHLVSKMPPNSAQMVKVDADWDTISEQNHENVVSDVKPSNLSYLIYTSGSTGKPKGVMVEHGNVVNFFAGMDQQIPHDEPGTWLAVTSLSFDISVLELFWTLAHGFKLVVFADKTRGQEAIALPASPHADKHIGFSLFFFSSDESEQGVEHKYDFLMKGVKFADQHGFEAVWTPERHFHAFGGLYPSPTVISAAIAVMTKNVRIRTGSYVSPLHSPIRAAEEWAVVDNLSNGRVDLGIAAGWQPNDFVLRPGNYPDRKEIMFRDIETVRKLWRGESIKVMNDLGKEIEVQTLPHPVQKELPVWITAASNPDTFKMAGERGFNVLTHLLGQSIEELAGKIDIYRQAWRDNGHEGEGHMSIMLHTFVSDDVEEAREISRAPLSNYLASAVSLVQKAAWHFPTFREKAKATGKSPFEMFDSDLLTAEDVEAVLDFAFERYFETSGIFGNPQKALKIVNQLKGVGVDEIGCLVDFGVPSSVVLDNLKYINELKEMATPKQGSDDFSIAAQINRHNVTHFQCTPSMARMLLMDEANKAALSKVQTVMIGGEAFSASLAAELQALVQGDVINMYGPTETTIWSSTYELNGMETAVSIGKPIANTQIYILDGQMQPVPVGVAGDLYIGGDGVVRGYHRRPELTAERFIQFNNQRVYKTGDLARYRSCGNIDFLGRADFQVKMRGYRIEMGEIEALLNEHPAVRDAVVVAREDVPSDLRLVAYLIPHDGQKVTNRELRGALKQQLPEFMVPAHFVTMDAFPLTPNKKTDRKALPAPDQMQMQTEVAYAPPTNELGESIAEIWRGLLNVQQIGINDNFFDIGGHSLFAVQAHRQIQQITEKKLSITDIFRFPTIRSLVNHLSQDSNGNGNGSQTAVKQSADRAASRREKMAQRRKRRQQG